MLRCVLLACVSPGTARIRPNVAAASSFRGISPALSEVLLPAQTPPRSPHLVSMACVLVLPALRGLHATATASASGLSPPSPEFFLLLIELVGKLLPLLITGLKQRQKGKVSPNHQDADGLQNELL